MKIAIPADGALLALSAALAAACFVKAFGVTFLGRPRTRAAADAREVDRFSLFAMFGFAALCLLAGILPGVVIDLLAPVTQMLTGASMPTQLDVAWLSIVPVESARSSYNGLLVFLFIAASASLTALVVHRFASRAATPRAGLGLRLSRSAARDAVHRRQLRATDPPRVRLRGISHT